MLVSVLLDGISMVYKTGSALRGLTLRIEDGEAVALLGPSGSGKTTVLRILAGFEKPTRGDVLFDGHRMNDVKTAERNLGMVFQDNVLFPMNVRENVGFPLSVRHLSDEEVARRVEAETRAVGIARLLERRPDQLSAGQQQLVQVARAMVRRPGLFLIDEPFARLDHLGTDRLRAELQMVQRGYGVTTVYATHDYGDAMALADRIAILEEGRIRQVGDPEEVYERPANTFVATFVGSPQMALLSATRVGTGVGLKEIELRGPARLPAEVLVGVRPEAWRIDQSGFVAKVRRIHHFGASSFADVEMEAGTATVRVPREALPTDELKLRPARYHLFDARTGRAIYHSV